MFILKPECEDQIQLFPLDLFAIALKLEGSSPKITNQPKGLRAPLLLLTVNSFASSSLKNREREGESYG